MRLRGRTDDCPIGLTEAMELWLGPSPGGSAFSSREELLQAWERGRDYIMRLWGSGARRPMAWWAFDTEFEYPGYYRERSFLWQHGILGAEERLAVEAEWRRDFDATRGMGARERREHYEHCDIPAELIDAWAGERRKRKKVAGVAADRPQKREVIDVAPSSSVEVPSETNNAPAAARTSVAVPLK